MLRIAEECKTRGSLTVIHPSCGDEDAFGRLVAWRSQDLRILRFGEVFLYSWHILRVISVSLQFAILEDSHVFVQIVVIIGRVEKLMIR